MDAASTNGVVDVRELRQNAIVRPTRARYKIYILDEAHMMSKSAFNALLKNTRRTAGTCQVYLLHDRGREDSNHDFVTLPTL